MESICISNTSKRLLRLLNSYIIPELPEALSKERNLGPGNTGTGMGSSGTGTTPGATSQGGGPNPGVGMTSGSGFSSGNVSPWIQLSMLIRGL